MAIWTPPLYDLVLERLLVRARPPVAGLSTGADVASHLLSIQPAPSPTSVRHRLRFGEHELLERTLSEYGELLVGGRPCLASLHADPDRDFCSGDQSILIRATAVEEAEELVHIAVWQVERSSNRTALAVRELVEVDELYPRRDSGRLERRLAEWADAVDFVPEYPRLRAALLMTPVVAERLSGALPSLRAMASIHSADLEIFTPTHDPRDPKESGKLERTLSSGRYHLLLTMSEPQERWVWAMARRFERDSRRFRALATTRAVDAVDDLASTLALYSSSWPARPAQFWDENALQRIAAREGDFFALTDRARSHLARNRYPDPERMIEHVERLADCAEAWHEEMRSNEISSERLEDWALRKFSLTIALHDKGIHERDAYIEFDGMRLDNRPHVKVDDGVPANECGRIYFAIDDRRNLQIRRLIVDHIGLHDRS